MRQRGCSKDCGVHRNHLNLHHPFLAAPDFLLHIESCSPHGSHTQTAGLAEHRQSPPRASNIPSMDSPMAHTLRVVSHHLAPAAEPEHPRQPQQVIKPQRSHMSTTGTSAPRAHTVWKTGISLLCASHLASRDASACRA